MVYSSQLLMINEETNSDMLVYYCLNWQLRVKNILKAKAEELERWYYKLASVLLNPL